MSIRAAGPAGAAVLLAAAITLTSCASTNQSGGAASAPAAGRSATSAAASGGSPSAPPTQTPAHAPELSPKQTAVAEAARLAARAVLPASRTLVTRLPKSPLPVLGRAAVKPSGVTATHSYRVPLSIAQARAWIAGHAPAGLKPGPNVVPQTELHPSVLAYSYTSATGQLTTGHLTITIVRTGAHSTLWTVTGSA